MVSSGAGFIDGDFGAQPDDRAAFVDHDVHMFEDILTCASDEPFASTTMSDEVAFWMYTSGSTGDPKGVKHVHTTPMHMRGLTNPSPRCPSGRR